MYDVIFYENRKGKREVEDYLYLISESNQITDKQVSKKLVIKLLGIGIKMPQAKYLKGLKVPLWGLRPLAERVF
ncbi:hypothetical protein [Lactobacillus helveticus]|uniref:hypothetical protein n=1 Tax=Lactobacillus helveticus TaxID=1587 RepID=UPI001562B48F|nr:hypothetical protein [Lactobacillus helveticus]NRN90039.1 hypothetical protein [Lactobacillus helveticus]NRO31555.1 hypothetical protein [Lactobacillus helveticus]NRO55227.1 hypothetical protein [Lactobacillus helveticus]